MDGRMRVLCAIPSTNQMYSGVGRALRELASRLTDRVAYSFAVDDLNSRNLELLTSFAKSHGMPVHVGRHRMDPRFVEPVNEDLPDRLNAEPWDAIELIGFANAGIGQIVMERVPDHVVIYTPHDQPLWTVPMSDEQNANVGSTHQRLLERADRVLADSRRECEELQSRVPWRSNVEYLPLGCDFDVFRAGTVDRADQLLFVGDLNESRKRFDRVARVFERLMGRYPALRLVVVGNKSDELGDRIPEAIRRRCTLMGYVSEERLRALYRESRGLFLLSDFEAFGLPILEAMACGTPVFLSRLATTTSLFGSYAGARFCPAEDEEATARIVSETLEEGREAVARVLADRERMRLEFGWDALADRKWRSMRSAWFSRNAWSWSA